jgi:hypothetical protein
MPLTAAAKSDWKSRLKFRPRSCPMANCAAPAVNTSATPVPIITVARDMTASPAPNARSHGETRKGRRRFKADDQLSVSIF